MNILPLNRIANRLRAMGQSQIGRSHVRVMPWKSRQLPRIFIPALAALMALVSGSLLAQTSPTQGPFPNSAAPVAASGARHQPVQIILTPQSYFPYTVRNANPWKPGVPLAVRLPSYEGIWYRAREGLVSDWVQSIVVDGRGTTWFGTDAGAVAMRPDGELRHYTAGHDGLPHDDVDAMAVDREGDAWFGGNLHWSDGSWGAVGRFDGRDFYTWRNTGDSGVVLGEIEAVAVDSADQKWFATTPRWYRRTGLTPAGVIRLTGRHYGQTEWTAWLEGDGISFRNCEDVVADGRGNVWLLADGRLARWSSIGSWADVARTEGEPMGWVYGIAVDAATDRLLVATEDALLWRAPGGTWSRLNDAPAARAMKLAVDGVGNLWYARYIEDEERVGVRWADESWFLFNEMDGPLYSWIHDIHVDPADNVWFGTSDGAVVLRRR